MSVFAKKLERANQRTRTPTAAIAGVNPPPPPPPPPGRDERGGGESVSVLAFTRYSFYVEAVVHTSILFFANTSLFEYPTRPLYRPHDCAIVFPPDPLCCNIYHMILVMAISCKGQRA